MAPAIKNTKSTSVKYKGKLITPVGSALFCSGLQPSAFNDKKIEASIIITEDEKNELEAKLTAFAEEFKDAVGVDMKRFQLPIKESLDADKNPDGRYVIKAKTGVQYPPEFYDAKGSKFHPEADFRISNGSRIRLSLGAELVKTNAYQGIVLRLRAIQIIDTVSFDSGFDAVDEGSFTADGSTTKSASSSEDAWE